VDFGGQWCQDRRHFRCKIDLLSSEGAAPQDCYAAKEELTSPDPGFNQKCRYISLEESALSVNFDIRVRCELAFHNVSQMFVDNPGSESLNYSVLNLSQNLVFSQPASLQMKLKVYNLNRLYDDSQVHVYEYTTNQIFLQQNQIAKVTFDPALVPKSFAVADRVFVEICNFQS
jgi:hypothetical protein